MQVVIKQNWSAPLAPHLTRVAMIEKMLQAGMNVARLNFSHGDFTSHKEVIEKIRSAAQKTGKRVAIMADLPGPKMRIGNFAEEPVLLEKDATFTLTTEQISGTGQRVSITMMAAAKGG